MFESQRVGRDFDCSLKGPQMFVRKTVCCWIGLAFVFPVSLVAADGHPLADADRAKLKKEFEGVVAQYASLIRENPQQVELYSRRGDALFFLGRAEEALADYEQMVKRNAKLDASHWRRGIAYFYAGKFEKAAGQFERYHTFDDVDRENGIWRYLSQYKAYGKPRAQRGLLKYKKDDREPFPDVYKLFAGAITGAEVLKRIAAADVDDREREKRRFYAELYIGLNDYVEGRLKSSQRHLSQAAKNTWAPQAGFGPSYMWHVGRLQYNLGRSRSQAAGAAKNKSGDK